MTPNFPTKFIPFDEFADEITVLPSAIKIPIYTSNFDVSRGSAYLPSEKFRMITSNDRTQQYSVVTDKYQLIQHKDAAFQVLNTVQSAGIEGNARIKSYGGRFFMEMIFSNMRIEDPTGSAIDIGYAMRNSYDSSGGVSIIPFAVRSICSNGMLFKKSIGLPTINIKHIGDIAEKVREALKQMVDNTLRVQGVFINVIDQASKNILEFSGNELELTISEYTGSVRSARRVIDSINAPQTGELSQYTIYNMLTEYATHHAISGSEYERISQGAEDFLRAPDLGEVWATALTHEAARQQIRNRAKAEKLAIAQISR